MALAIQWTRTADKKFASIIEHLDKEWGEITVRKFVKKVDDFLEKRHKFMFTFTGNHSNQHSSKFLVDSSNFLTRKIHVCLSIFLFSV